MGLLVRFQHTHFAPYVERVFFNVFRGIHHSKYAVQVPAVELLGDCLAVWYGRHCYPRIYSQIDTGFTRGRDETVNGVTPAGQKYAS